MKRKVMGVLLGVIMMTGLALGYYLRADLLRIVGAGEQKPVIHNQNVDLRIDSTTPIILEKEYSRSSKVVITEFENEQDVIGCTLEEIRRSYTKANGFTISLQAGTLVIHQVVEDWTPEDKAKCRLKQYKDLVAIYVGPTPEHDSLLKVTAIRFSSLPASIRKAIQQGKYEFENEDAINDALENLDEYF